MRVYVALCALGLGCSDPGPPDPGEDTPDSKCSELSELCREAADAGLEDAETCDAIADEGDEAECEADLEECRSLCGT